MQRLNERLASQRNQADFAGLMRSICAMPFLWSMEEAQRQVDLLLGMAQHLRDILDCRSVLLSPHAVQPRPQPESTTINTAVATLSTLDGRSVLLSPPAVQRLPESVNTSAAVLSTRLQPAAVDPCSTGTYAVAQHRVATCLVSRLFCPAIQCEHRPVLKKNGHRLFPLRFASSV